MQVFPTKGWKELFEGLQKSTVAGGPTFHLAEYDVMNNAEYGVHGGWKVRPSLCARVCTTHQYNSFGIGPCKPCGSGWLEPRQGVKEGTTSNLASCIMQLGKLPPGGNPTGHDA